MFHKLSLFSTGLEQVLLKIMEDSSVLKVRSDLYPHAVVLSPTGGMTSITPTSSPQNDTSPICDGPESATPILSSSCPNSTARSPASSRTPEREIYAASSWGDAEPWRKEGKEGLSSAEHAHLLPLKESSATTAAVRSYDWPTSPGHAYDCQENSKHSSEVSTSL